MRRSLRNSQLRAICHIIWGYLSFAPLSIWWTRTGICVNADHELTDERFDTILSILSGKVLAAASSGTVPGSTSQLDDRRTQTAGGGQEDTGT
ncbi:hypothetical protein N7488_004678 [Penicillium malachiteum]|nr:hypothetical protein N7488_004678 [Penicillium malachiteum]